MNKLGEDIRNKIINQALAETYWKNPARRVVLDHAALYQCAAEQILSASPVIYLEFGVAQGGSIAQIAQKFSHRESRFIGFDSFIGLPEPWLMHDKGGFSNQGQPPVTEDSRIRFVKGWFQNTLPDFLKEFRPEPDRETLVHFDADLYSSTLFLLCSLWPCIPEYYFIMDDFIYDDVVALTDFIAAYPVELEFLAQTRGGGPGPNPDQVLGRMRRIPLRIEGLDG